MATVTPIYNWPVPTSTDYVKDGATAIEALGDAIDATSAGANMAGLVLVKAQTVGSGVSSQAVTSCFNATYDQYKVVLSGVSFSTSTTLSFQLTGLTSGYNNTLIYQNLGTATVIGAASGAASSFNYAGNTVAGSVSTIGDITVYNPFNAGRKLFEAMWSEQNVGSSVGRSSGLNLSTTSYSGCTITPAAGTMTGGVIAVYGYRKGI
jgi:hypothetical protein